jgi:hypothetical protein
MFFKGYFNSVADILEARLKGYERDQMNPADKGELCEVFIKEFLQDALGDNFRILRGGKVVNCLGEESKQLDIVLCSKRTIKIFSDKGIYPTETVKGVISITSTLDLTKLDKCLEEFNSIPKTNYHFIGQKFYPEKFREETQRVFEDATPVTCIFAYYGDIETSWKDHLVNWIKRNNPNHSLTPDIIIVNKKGMIFKHLQKIGEKRFSATYHYIDFRLSSHPGEAFSRMLNELYNLSHEELFMQPDYTFYFNSDLEDAN